jgi:multicomponent Na+:H+ antiporter subunit C
MNGATLYFFCSFMLFFSGLYGMLFVKSLLMKTLSLNFSSAGLFLFLVARAYNGVALPPDPVPHGLVLTGIVISASATALLLFLSTVLHALPESPPDEGADAS